MKFLASAVPEIFKGGLNPEIGHVTSTTPLSGTVCHRQAGSLGHAMINLRSKFEVPAFIRYGEIKGVAKCRIGWFRIVRGHPRSLAMLPFDRAHTTSYE